jgi:hypothetical protein
VLRHLSTILEALREYDLFGAERIREEVSVAIGSAFFHRQAQRAGEPYWNLVIKIGNLVQTGAATAYLASEFLKLLPGH